DRDAEEMVREIRGFPLLDGYRGAPKANVASVVDLLHRISRLASEQEEVAEMDLNPVLVFHGEAPCVALDARVRLLAGVAA
ncbi:MAG TPA: acetate--CoA ligase family protein, partial [Candidatus Binatia bacterium]|nr:acetate--CoA ligase family protein [Candidatus Binatia bacterium]